MQEYEKKLALCGSLQGYEQFKLEWTMLCYLLNPSKENRKRVKQLLLNQETEE